MTTLPRHKPVSDASLRAFAGYHMKRAFNVIKADLIETLKPFDLRMVTYSTLVLIVDNPGLRQAQMADALMIERPNFVAIIDELETAGLITRQRAPEDRRAYALMATLSGQAQCKWATEAVNAHEHRVFGVLSDAERRLLLSALGKIEINAAQ